MEERGSVGVSGLYQKKCVEVLNRQIGMCPKGNNMQLRTAEKELVLYPMDMSPLRMLEGRVHRRVLQMSADRVFWN